jgi:outer membrane lipoprotein SlyB
MIGASMRFGLSIPLVALLLSGCATQEIYSKPGLTQASLDQDHAYCQLLAMNTPQQQTPVTVYTAHTTTYGSYSTTTVGPDPYAQFGAALGDTITNEESKTTARRLCMQSKGYTFVGEKSL